MAARRNSTLTITITGTNDGPVANPDTNTVAEDTVAPVTGNVLTNDTDIDGDALVVTTTGAQVGPYGTVTINADGSYSFALNNGNATVQALGVGETLIQSFNYTISDGNGGTSTSTLTITITGTNDGPVAVADTAVIAEDTVAPVTGSVLTNDTDLDGDALAVTTTGGQAGTYGSVTIAANGAYSYSLNNANPAVQALGVGQTLTETFSYSISDGNGGTSSSTLTITITGTNDGPVAVADTAVIAEDTVAPVTGNVLTNDTDVDTGDTMTVTTAGLQTGTYGAVTIAANGAYSYTLNNANPVVQALGVGQTLTETFSYSISDGQGGTATSTLTITITGTNDGPVANPDTNTVAEDTVAPVTGNVLSNDSDVDTGDTLTVTTTGAQIGTYGTVTIAANGAYSFALNNGNAAVQALGVGQTLTQSFNYTISDGQGGTSTSTLTITITGTNDGPVANPDTNTVAEDTVAPVTGNVLTNDTDVDTGDVLTVTTTGAQTGTYGTVTIAANGAYSFALNNGNAAVQALGVGQTLTQSFNYTISDGNGGTSTSTLTITISGTNDGPVAVADTAVIAEDTVAPVTGNVLTNDTDVDTGDVLTVTTTGAQVGTYGTVTINADGTYSFTLNNGNAAVQALGVGETLTQSFNYSISDGNGGTSSSTLTITITGTNDGPVANPDANTVAEDTVAPITGNVLTNDTDVDGDTLTVTTTAPQTGAYGTVTIAANGSYSFTLNNANPAVQTLGVGQTLTQSFNYTISDGNGGTSTSTLTITITGTNDGPVATPDVATIAEDTVAPITGNVLTNDTDVDTGDTLTVTTTGAQTGPFGTVTIAADGTYSFTLNNGNAAVQALGVGQSLTQAFNYTISDGHGGTSTSTLTITITGTNDGPVATPDVATIAEDTVAPITGNVLANDTDVDTGDTLTVTTTGAQTGPYGTVTIAADGTYSFTLNNGNAAVQALGVGQTLTQSFNYTISDGHGGTSTSTLTVTITGTNDGPTANADVAVIAEDTIAPITGNVLTNDTDVDTGDTLTVTTTGAQTGPFGTVTIAADGTYSFALNNGNAAVQALGVGQSLTQAFNYTISDGHGGTSTSTLTITITGTNDGPVANADVAVIAEDAVAPVTGNVLTNDTDVDTGDVLTVTTTGGQAGAYGSVTIAATGAYSYTLNSANPLVQALGVGQTLTETFNYSISDGHGGTSTSTLTITITGTNDGPVANADVAVIAEDTVAPVTGNVLTNDTDVDTGDVLTVTTTGGQTGTYGSVTIAANGSYSYALNNANPAVQALGVGQTLTETFNYSISDGHGGTSSSTLTITIAGTNDGPVANPDTNTVAEDTVAAVTGNVLTNDTDVDTGDTLTVTTTGAQTGPFGTVTIAADGTYSFALNNGNAAVQALGVGQSLTQAFNYTISDGHGGTSTSTLTITITGTNDGPTANADVATIAEDTVAPVTGNVLTNDTDPDSGDTLTVTTTAPQTGPYGTVTINANGSYSFALNNGSAAVQALGVGQTLTQSFNYTISDGHGGTSTSTLTITIIGTNDGPVAVADTATIAEDTAAPVAGNVLTNDTDVDTGDVLTVTTTGGQTGTYGSVTIAANGAYSYTLNNANPAVQALGVGQTLTETFNYSISDGHGGTSTSTLTITITGTNDGPVANPDSNTVAEDTVAAVTGNVLTNDTDPDTGDTLTVTTTGAQVGTYGTVTIAANGAYSFALDNGNAAVQALGVGQTLTQSFNYTISDGNGGTSTSTLTITITGTNDGPVANPDTNTIAEDAVAAVTGNVLTNDTDVDTGDALTVTSTGPQTGPYGTVTIAADGAYSFTLNNGNAAVQALGVGQTLTQSFNYTISDGNGGTSISTLTITITGTNDGPTANADVATIAEDTVAPVTGNVLTNDTDVDTGEVLTVTTTGGQAGTYGSVTIAANGAYSYTLNNANPAVQALGVGQTLTETFSYSISDGHGGTSTSTLTITITGTNDGPVANADAATIAEDTVAPVTGNLLTNDTDVDTGDVLTVTTTGAQVGTYGTVTIAANGAYSFTLNNGNAAVQALGVGQTLTQSFNYTISDGHGGTSTSTLTITITGTNDGPVANADTNTIAEDAVAAVTGNVLTNDTDADTGDTLTVTTTGAQTGTYGTVTIAANGAYSFTLNNGNAAVQALGVGQTLTQSFNYTISDGNGGTSTSTLTITITGTNDGPVANADTNTIAEDTVAPVTGNVLTNDTDVDTGDVLTVTTTGGQAGTYGSVTIAANGAYSYTLNNANAAVQALGVGQTLTETFNYSISDGHGGTSTSTLTITITGTNDGPVATPDTATIAEDTVAPVTGNVLTNDTDVDTGDVLTVTTTGGQTGTYGSVTIAANGAYSYTLNNANAAVQALGVGQTLTETFNYSISDGHGGTSSSNLTITITGTNDGPVANPDTATIAEDTVAPIAGNVLTNDTDVDSADVLTVTTTGAQVGTYGTVTIAANGAYSFTLNNGNASVQALGVGQTLTQSFNYTISDGHGGTSTSTLTITITGTNDGPVANPDTNTIAEDTVAPVTGNVLTNDTDTDTGSTLTVTTTGAQVGTYGTVTIAANGTYSFTLNNGNAAVQALGVGQTLTQSFNYTISDGNGGTSTSTLTITITGTNDGPVANPNTATIAEDTVAPVTGNVLTNDTDPDTGDVLTVTTTGGQTGTYGSVTIAANGAYSYTLNNANAAVQALGVGQTLTETFNYTISDGHGGTSTSTLTITITGTNDGPVANADAATIAEDTAAPVTGNVLTNDTDVDTGDVLTVTTTGAQVGTYGTVTIAANGAYSFTLNNGNAAVQALGVGQTLTQSFNYTISDGHGGTSTSTLTITITGTNDGPVANPDTATIAEETVAPITGNVLTNDTDVDLGDVLTVTTTGAQVGTYGTVTIAANGAYSFALNNGNAAVQALGVGQTLTQSFNYTNSDGHGGTSTSTLTITITGTNDGPVANPDTNTIAEDTVAPVTGNVLTNDTDTDTGSTLTVTTTGAQVGAYGTVTIAANGAYSFTLNNGSAAVQALGVGQTLTQSFNYTISDGQGGTSTSTLTITITGTNDGPVANPNTATIAEDTVAPVTGNVVTNDTDVDTGDTLTVTTTGAQTGSYGTVTIAANGAYSYALNNANPTVQALGVGETLTETFNYTISDGHGGTSTSTLTITVTGTNDAPTTTGLVNQAGVDATSFTYNTGTAFSDVEGDTLTFSASGLPAGVSIDTNTGVISGTFANDASVGGPYTVTVTANDGNGGMTSANFVLTVTNPPPYVIGPSNLPVYVDSNSSGGFNPGETNSTFTNGDIASGTGVTHTRNFDVPAGAEAGDVRIVVTLTTLDNSGTIVINGTNLSSTGSFEFELANLNSATDTGAGRDDTLVQFVGGGTMTQPWVANVNGLPRIQFIVTENGVEIWGTPLTTSAALVRMELVGGTFNLPVLVDGQNTIAFTNFNDNGLDGVNGSITITHDPLPNQAFNEGATVSFDTADNFADPDNDVLTYSATGLPAGLSIDTNTGVIFGVLDPSAATGGAGGVYTVTVTANDGQGGTASDTFTFTAAAINNPPVANADAAAIAEDTASTAGNVITNDNDPEGAAITVTQVNGSGANVGASLAGTYGSLVLNSNGTYTYSLNNGNPTVQALGVGESLTETFTYQITAGGQTASTTLTITINGTNDGPVADDDNYSTSEDTPLIIAAPGLMGNDTDLDGDTLTPSIVNGPTNGILTLNADGSFTYTPNSDYSGPDFFTYQVSDGNGGVDTATVVINVNSANDNPVAVNDSYQVAEDGVLTVGGDGVLTNDSDADGDLLSASLVSGPANGSLTLNADGTFTYTPNSNYNGPDSFTYQVSDGNGGTSTATVNIDVVPVTDQPVAIDDVATVDESSSGGTSSSNVINVVVVLDRSGSMDADPDGAGPYTTRLELAQAAINNMLALYGANGQVNVLVVAFDSSSMTSGWLTGSGSVSSAQTYVNSITLGGNTNYSSAIGTVQAAYSHNTPPADNTVLYFITDGVPTGGTSLSSTNTVTVWENFLSSNGITQAYAIGVNSAGVAPGPLDEVAHPGSATIITNETQLPTILTNTVEPVTNTVSGDVDLNDNYGPDGPGYVQSIQVGAVTYTYNQGTNQYTDGTTTFAGSTLTATTPLGGELVFNFLTGQYTYTAPEVTSDQSETFNYVLRSSTGGTDGASLTINIRNVTRAPIVNSRVLWIPDDIALIPTTQGYPILAAPPIDPDGDPVTIMITGTPADGTLYYNSTGGGIWVALPVGSQSTALTSAQFLTLRYRPDGDGVQETLTVTYTATDGTRTTVGTITINTMVGGPGITVPGSSSDDTIYGTPNADTLNGSGGADIVIAGAGNDSVNGGDGADRLEGGDGNDTIDGGNGNDSMLGGNGNDVLILSAGTDVIDGGANTDVLDFTAATGAVTYTVVQGATDSTLNLATSGLGVVVYRNIEGAIGGAFNDSIAGSGSADLIGGGGGDDTLLGNGGADVISGGDGNDSMDGGTGNDTMAGGDGSDIYVVNSTSDVVTELAGEGTDSVFSSVTLTLAANVENLTLTGTSGLGGTGNTLDNVITGNSGANALSGGGGNDTIDGGTGNDTMTGGTGDDLFFVNSSSDVVTEASGEGTELGAKLRNLYPRQQCREPDADRSRQHQWDRQHVGQHHRRQYRKQQPKRRRRQ